MALGIDINVIREIPSSRRLGPKAAQKVRILAIGQDSCTSTN